MSDVIELCPASVMSREQHQRSGRRYWDTMTMSATMSRCNTECRHPKILTIIPLSDIRRWRDKPVIEVLRRPAMNEPQTLDEIWIGRYTPRERARRLLNGTVVQ